MVQPIGSICLNVLDIKSDKKLNYNAYYGQTNIFDLQTDSVEKKPQKIDISKDEIPPVVQEFLHFSVK
jgi:hypothetical protein